MTTSDQELLRAYAEEGSERAFGELVGRYTDLVYSAALRQVQQRQLAEEVTQSTFILLARKAARLKAQVILSGWLLRAAHFIAMDLLKSEYRRRKREQLAVTMEEVGSSAAEVERAWQEILPVLDVSLSRLASGDRDALTLRFFEKKPLEEVGRSLGISEEAAKKRVARALERLRGIFQKQKALVPAAIVGAALSAYAVQAAPAGLAATVAKAALVQTAGGVAGGVGILGWFRLNRVLFSALSVALLLVPLAWQAARSVSLREEQHRLEGLLASLQLQARDLASEQARLERELRRSSNSLARLETPPAIGAALLAGADTNLNPNLFLWHETDDYVRLPKALLDWIGFDGQNNRSSVGVESDSEPVFTRETGRLSPTLLKVLGVDEATQQAVQAFCQSNTIAYQQFVQSRSCLTNAQALDFTGQSYIELNDDSRAWITPPLGNDGEAWRQAFREGLAALIGGERARLILRQAMDEGSLGRCFNGFGAQQLVIGVTPLANGQCYLFRRKTLEGEIIGGMGRKEPISDLLAHVGLPDWSMPPALETYLRQWQATHSTSLDSVAHP